MNAMESEAPLELQASHEGSLATQIDPERRMTISIQQLNSRAAAVRKRKLEEDDRRRLRKKGYAIVIDGFEGTVGSRPGQGGGRSTSKNAG